MKVKLGQLMQASGTAQAPGPLQKLVNVDEFCIGLKHRLAKLAIAVNDALRSFNVTKDALVQKHGSIHKILDAEGRETGRDEQTPSVRPADESWPKFAEEFDVLANEEVDLRVDPVILPPEADGKGVTAADLIALNGLVTVRGEESGPTKVVE